MHARARFFVDGRYDAGETVTISGQDAHRIVRVLRMQPGDGFTLCDGAGQVFSARLDAAGSDCTASLLALEVPPPQPEITLAQCMPKAAKMDFVVEKAIECGAARIIPVRSERVIAERGGHAGKIDRWRRLARSASEQSGAPRLAEVTEPVDWAELMAGFAAYDCVLIPWESAPPDTRKLDALPNGPDARIMVVIGPEGGLSHAETAAAAAAGARLFTLGSRILRTETAGAVAIGVLTYALDIQAAA